MKNELKPNPYKMIQPPESFSYLNQRNEASSFVVIKNGLSSKYIRVISGTGNRHVEIEYREEKNQSPGRH